MKTRQGHKRKNESEQDEDKSDPDYQPPKQARAVKETDVKQQRLEHARKFAEAKRESQIKRMEIKSSRLQAERDALRRQVQWLQDQVLHRLPASPADAPMPDPPDVPLAGPVPDVPPEAIEFDAPVEVDNVAPEAVAVELDAPVKEDNVQGMLESKVQAPQTKWQVIHSASFDVPRSVLLRGKGCKGLPDEYLNEEVGVPIRIVQAPDDPSIRCLVAADLYMVCQINKGNMAKQVKMHVTINNRMETRVKGIKSRNVNVLTLDGIRQLVGVLRTKSRSGKSKQEQKATVNRGLVWLSKLVLPHMASAEAIRAFCVDLALDS